MIEVEIPDQPEEMTSVWLDSVLRVGGVISTSRVLDCDVSAFAEGVGFVSRGLWDLSHMVSWDWNPTSADLAKPTSCLRIVKHLRKTKSPITRRIRPGGITACRC